MKIKIADHLNDETHVIDGDHMEVEVQLRRLFRTSLQHVPHGCLAEILETLSHMYGLMVTVDGVVPARPPRYHKEVELTDPWPREIDDIPGD